MSPRGALCALVLTAVLTACNGRADPLQAFAEGDYLGALALWKSLAEQGDAQAQNYLGILYHLGLGVEREYRQAVKWYRQAAANGNADAQRNLGTMYQFGFGVPQSNLYSYAWYYSALRHGNLNARNYIQTLSTKLTPNQIMKARVLLRHEVGSESRDAAMSG